MMNKTYLNSIFGLLWIVSFIPGAFIILSVDDFYLKSLLFFGFMSYQVPLVIIMYYVKSVYNKTRGLRE